ncbi:hypothetical protein IST455A_05747 [Burkholderia multivorans]|uniref:acyl dehydratase n=1 Tax=Burkholderia multivorans TaxID=87883 RepID=UPI0019B19610|nr:acyl dehydratase [Burkholderia multivorans]CAB5301258.1 hypothetical protein IST419_05794 [Burkholderia multivorans]CAB5310746.1 hypothetical protein IST424_05779 [Burkholderia multivorans]CAB5312458.1 hypothetical protein IST455A_05747 [Burkholderia multivorans]CAB5312761.1 hypothetical protein IST453_05801 [Burkholderia multivorans]CAB5314216.1 hypothetical protein IST455B_05780 [Burkholderia multivorans]
MPVLLKGIDGILAHRGFLLGRSSWLDIDPEMVYAFERVLAFDEPTDIRARWTGAVADQVPCYLLVSLVLPMLREIYVLEDTAQGMHSGIDSLCFLAPVPERSSVRLAATLEDVRSLGGGWELALACVMECDAVSTPVLSAKVRFRFEICKPGTTADFAVKMGVRAG